MTYFIQTSTDGGKSFRTTKWTANRNTAFVVFESTARTERTRMFKDNHLMLTTHLEDAQAELAKVAVKA